MIVSCKVAIDWGEVGTEAFDESRLTSPGAYPNSFQALGDGQMVSASIKSKKTTDLTDEGKQVLSSGRWDLAGEFRKGSMENQLYLGHPRYT